MGHQMFFFLATTILDLFFFFASIAFFVRAFSTSTAAMSLVISSSTVFSSKSLSFPFPYLTIISISFFFCIINKGSKRDKEIADGCAHLELSFVQLVQPLSMLYLDLFWEGQLILQHLYFNFESSIPLVSSRWGSGQVVTTFRDLRLDGLKGY